MTKDELVSMLLRFVGEEPDPGPWEWDDFTSVRAEPELESFRQRLLVEVDPLLGRDGVQAEIKARVLQVVADLRAEA